MEELQVHSATKLNAVQLHLLEMFSGKMSESESLEIKELYPSKLRIQHNME